MKGAGISKKRIFAKLNEEAVPKQRTEMKQKDLFTPWMTKGLLKYSERKQKSYKRYLKK